MSFSAAMLAWYALSACAGGALISVADDEDPAANGTATTATGVASP